MFKTYVVLAISIVLNAAANIFMKAGALKPKENNQLIDVFINMATNSLIWGGISCFALGLAAYNYALVKMNLSVAYPINTSVGYIIVVLASWVLFKESLTIVQISGIAVISVGVWMVAR